MSFHLVKDYAISVISTEMSGNIQDNVKFFTKLWDCNLIDRKRVLRACINHYYGVQFRMTENNSREAIMDTSIQFEVSENCVSNTIYKYSSITLNSL